MQQLVAPKSQPGRLGPILRVAYDGITLCAYFVYARPQSEAPLLYSVRNGIGLLCDGLDAI